MRLRKWKKIKDAFDDLIPFRNRLAHDPSTRIVHAHGFSDRPLKELPPIPSDIWEIYEETATRLVPKKKGQKIQKLRIALTYIQKHIINVEVLLQMTQEFWKKLPKRL